MSVINKMLRDLDQRHESPDAASTPKGVPVDQGTASVQGLPRRSTRPAQTRWLKVMLPGMVIMLMLTVWEWQVGDLDKLRRAFSGQPRTLVPPPLPKILEVSQAAAPTPGAAKAVARPSVATSPTAAQAAPAAVAPTSPTPAVAQAAKPAPAATGAQSTRTTRPAPPKAVSDAPAVPAQPAPAAAAQASSPAVAQPVPPSPQDIAQRQQQALREALTQAQTQWNGGARASAIELLQQALGAAERAANATPGPASQGNLAAVVRELSRMQLAEGHAQAVWDLTVRMEPLLRADPDVWAVRANAAQRLGRHQDSVHAYLIALQSRPSEQRWLLGTAVSLAALGQASSATDMAERARAAGPISKEVSTYLRQMGVVLREP